MPNLIMPRRRFLAGLVGLVAAPMVVRAAALMPVKAFEMLPPGAVRCANGAILQAFYKNGLITGVSILNAGSGYVSAPVITFAEMGASLQDCVVWTDHV